jgi:hypothetical protein
MITEKDINIDYPLNKNYKIDNLLFRDINYVSEKLEDGFISRDVNHYENENVGNFTEIINDCSKIIKYEGDKYNQLILEKKEPGEDSDDNIDNLIKNLENSINSNTNQIRKLRKQTDLLENSIPNEYKSRYTLRGTDVEIIQRLDLILKEFSEGEYNKYDL